ncbi:MAG TPA: HAD family phosphatase [Clostridiales bacterium]|nr:HAD family phosphatase [Clostridiales bacterium]
MKALYISDLDGTLLQPDVTLSRYTVDTLNELMAGGMEFTVATARTIASVKHILKDLNLAHPIILMNGVCIYDLQKQEYVKVETLSQGSIRELMKVIEKNSLKGFVYTIKDSVLATYYEDLNTEALRDFYQERVDLYGKRFTQVDRFSDLSGEPIIYFSLLDHREKLEPIYHQIQSIPDLACTFYRDNYAPDFWFLETFSSSASKYHATRYLRASLGAERVICFGDNRNDLPLFEASDQKIAVGNAVDELKEKADQIASPNTEDGVANWLRQNYK